MDDMAFRIDVEKPLRAALVETAGARLEKAAKATGDRTIRPAERVHAVRKTAKKIRALLKLVRGYDQKRYARDNTWLRDTARQLSELRDAEVLLSTWQAVRGHFGDQLAADGFAEVRGLLLAHRRKHRPPAEVFEQRLMQSAKRLQEAAQRLRAWSLPADDFGVVEAGFTAIYRRARQAAAAAEQGPEDERFHEWRKAAKAHAYHLRLLQCAWPPLMKAWRREADALAAVLGDEHDLSVLRQHLMDAPVPPHQVETVQAAIALIEARREELRSEALRQGRYLFAEKPKVVAARVGAWWTARKASDPGAPETPRMRRSRRSG